MADFGISDRLFRATTVALAALAAGCAGGGAPLPALPAPVATGSLSNATLAGLVESTHQPQRSAEIYSRIARGANACWFGPRGRLSTTHILHADAAPSMNGGKVEVIVHERAVDQPTPWGPRSFRIELAESTGMDGTAGGGGTGVAVENLRFPDAVAARMRAEVLQWAAGSEGCKVDPALDGPPPAAAPRPEPASPPSRTPRQKS
jgi:hypothetical protein